MLIFLVIYLIAAAAWFSYRKLLEQRETQRRREMEMAFQRRIQQDPGNVAAYEGLGDSYRAGGRLGDALSAYQQALEVGGDQTRVGSIQYKIRQIQLDLDSRARRRETPSRGRQVGKAKDLQNCVFCGGSNPLSARKCEECGQDLLHDTFLSSLETLWTDQEQRKKILESSAVIIIPILCIAFASTLSLEVKGILIISTTIVGAWVFLNSFSGKRY